ncbi:MAG: hypothetical protein O6943_06290 [Bacteroidetes bacterium]|nr:hypothetical protein [Bacteroidota bacterium]
MEVLIRSGANIEIESGEIHQNTPLGWAVVAGSVNMVKFLLRQGAEKQDYYFEECQKGLKSEFLEVKPVDLEIYNKILDYLKPYF